MTTPTIIEETWWDVTTATGLTLRLPAPLRSISTPSEDATNERRIVQPADPRTVLQQARKDGEGIIQSHSEITGLTYALDTTFVLAIQVFVRKEDPERLIRSQMKAAGLSTTSSTSGPAATSSSDDPTNPNGPSIGARIRRRTH
jgi:hypothetical protein